MTANTLGTRVRAVREELGIEAADLAKAAGMAYSTLMDIENERQKRSTKLHRIAAVLGVHPDWLESGEGPRNAAEGPALPKAADQVVVHGFQMSREAASLAAEWEKIEDAELKRSAADLILRLVAKQKRDARKKKTEKAQPSRRADA